jgi:peroxiredoxin
MQEIALQDLTGKPAIPFTLRDRRGTTHQLDEYRGKWLLMVFHRHLG